ncbi:hypothetical protein RvY_00806 [Ramazzottius varieornatus]|uniref:Zinc finger CHCC-type domain-containing protein n=1 Tax=Ramazzottius varieornatus TaxID=947166 RepID=A0A1D1UI23_RAMVA|nr:hypothetical protein RvY_00806 [Ramazzottius varieornatus]
MLRTVSSRLTHVRLVPSCSGCAVPSRAKSDQIISKVSPDASTEIATIDEMKDDDKINLQLNKGADELLEDVKTHTGQKWDSEDYRMLRYVKFPKLVNARPAIQLIAEVPPVAVQGSRTFCDGGGGPLGHPKVFINVDKPGNHACGYCGIRFFKDEHHEHEITTL